jgi:ketosteroid isomerase-like protein
MRKFTSVLAMALLGLGLASCATEPGPTFTEADRAEIQATTEAVLEIANTTGDHTAYGNLYYAPDVVMMPPNREAVRGREAVIAWQHEMAPYESLQYTQVEVDGAGDMAYVYGNYTLTMPAAEGEEPMQDRGKYIEIWRRQPDGSWKVTLGVFNSDLPLPAEGT